LDADRAYTYKKNIEEASLHKFLGLNIEKIENGEALLSMPVQGSTLNPAGSLHGGVVYLAADVAAFSAIGSILCEDEFAVTIDIHCSIYKGTRNGPILYKAKVAKRTRRLAFINVEVTDYDVNLIAEARVTKAITRPVPKVFQS